MRGLLVAFGIIFMIVGTAAVLVPWLRRKRDLMTSWNLFLLGAVNFAGLSAIQTGSTQWHRYGSFDGGDILRYLVGSICFWVTVFLVYYLAKFPRQIGASRLRKWANPSTPAVLFAIGLCALMTLGNVYVPQVQFLGQIAGTFGGNAPMIMLALALFLWHRRRWNPFWLAGVVLAFIWAGYLGISAGSGRRNFMSAICTVPLCFYWLSWRYKSLGRVVVPMLLGAAMVGVGVIGLSLARSVNIRASGRFELATTKVIIAPTQLMEHGSKWASFLGGDATEAGLTAVNLYTKWKPREQVPFFTLYYILAQPIPRAWWPEKPRALGETLPLDTGWVSKYGPVSWGASIVGHCYQEGGWYMAIFYGLLFGAAFRFFDEILVRNASNPFVLGILGTASSHIVGLSRGDMSLFCSLILGICLTCLLLSFVTRMIFGTKVYGEGSLPQSEQEPSPAFAEPVAVQPLAA